MFEQINYPKIPFKVAVISDEISQDFDYACFVVSKKFNLQWVELRSLWGKNLQHLSDAELAHAELTLCKYHLRVTDIASPLFKVDWPGAPRSRFSTENDSFQATFSFEQQHDVLEHSIALARRFMTNRIRCFDFWRLDDVKPYREAIYARLSETASICGKQDILLMLENEFACNTATGREAVETLAAINSPHFMLVWDPANAVMAGEFDAFDAAWNLLPKKRIGHCHCKNAIENETGRIDWESVGAGRIDWTAQFRALAIADYRNAVSLETHWRGAGSPEASTFACWQQMEQALQAGLSGLPGLMATSE